MANNQDLLSRILKMKEDAFAEQQAANAGLRANPRNESDVDRHREYTDIIRLASDILNDEKNAPKTQNEEIARQRLINGIQELRHFTHLSQNKQREYRLLGQAKKDRETESRAAEARNISLAKTQREESLRDQLAAEKRHRDNQPKFKEKFMDARTRAKAIEDVIKTKPQFIPETAPINRTQPEDKEISRRHRIREKNPNPYERIKGEQSPNDFSYNELPSIFREHLIRSANSFLPNQESFLRNTPEFSKDYSPFLEHLQLKGKANRQDLQSKIDADLDLSFAAKKNKEENILKELSRIKRRENKPEENARLLKNLEAQLNQAVQGKQLQAIKRIRAEMSSLRPDATEAEQDQYINELSNFEKDQPDEKKRLQYQNLTSLSHPQKSDDQWDKYQGFLRSYMSPQKIGYKQNISDIKNNQMRHDDWLRQATPQLEEAKIETKENLDNLLNRIRKRHRSLGGRQGSYDVDIERANQWAAKQLARKAQSVFENSTKEAQSHFNNRQLLEFEKQSALKRQKEAQQQNMYDVAKRLRYEAQHKTRKKMQEEERNLKDKYGEVAFNYDKR